MIETDTSADLSHLSPAEVPEESLYKSDPTRKSKSEKTTFTRQTDIEEVRCVMARRVERCSDLVTGLVD